MKKDNFINKYTKATKIGEIIFCARTSKGNANKKFTE